METVNCGAEATGITLLNIVIAYPSTGASFGLFLVCLTVNYWTDLSGIQQLSAKESK